MKLAGQIALITGSSRGLGEFIAKRFAKKPAILTAEIGVRKGLGSKLIMNYG